MSCMVRPRQCSFCGRTLDQKWGASSDRSRQRRSDTERFLLPKRNSVEKCLITALFEQRCLVTNSHKHTHTDRLSRVAWRAAGNLGRKIEVLAERMREVLQPLSEGCPQQEILTIYSNKSNINNDERCRRQDSDDDAD